MAAASATVQVSTGVSTSVAGKGAADAAGDAVARLSRVPSLAPLSLPMDGQMPLFETSSDTAEVAPRRCTA